MFHNFRGFSDESIGMLLIDLIEEDMDVAEDLCQRNFADWVEDINKHVTKGDTKNKSK